MKGANTRTVSRHDAGWLERENPPVHYMIRAMEGDERACQWLEGHSRGLCLFAKAITGDKKALASLKTRDGLELDDLFAIIGTSDLPDWFQERHPDLHDLFAAIRGDDAAFGRLKKNSPLGKVAQIVRDQARADPPAAPAVDGQAPDLVSEDTAADMSCLVGELHLSKGDFEKAIEAFGRAIATEPTADAYEGRARAYHGLAAHDERRAAELRGGRRG
jgi:tetratricopeptide (TPR) repeat protein